jgi:probable rRNA maturation factor
MKHGTAGSDSRRDKFVIAVANEQAQYAVDEEQLAAAARAVLAVSPFRSANVSVAVVDDPAIHELNVRYLDHDWPTDVLSFVLEESDGHLEGEVILSAETAAAAAQEVGWPLAAELLLYAVHGMLHLVGYRDNAPADAQAMRAAEANILAQFGLEQPAKARGTSGGVHAAGHSSRDGARAQ